MSSSKSFSKSFSSKHFAKKTIDCPYMSKPGGCTKFDCPYVHPSGYIRMCPYMNTPSGCTNLNCPYAHPSGFVHACIFGMNCNKRATGECEFLHPDQRGFANKEQKHAHAHHNKHKPHNFVPRREAPPPPTPPRDVPSVSTEKIRPEKDEFGHILVYDNKGVVIGIFDNDHFVSFIMDIPIEVQKADHAWDAEIDDYDPEDDE